MRERIQIKLEGERQVAEVRELIALLGPEHVREARIAAVLVKMRMPTTLIGGGSGDLAEQILRLMPFIDARAMLRRVVQGSYEQQVPSSDLLPQPIADAVEDQPPTEPDARGGNGRP